MIAKIKLIYVAGKPEYVFKREITTMRHHPLQPQVGMTVIIPQDGKESFRFYVTHLVADLRTGDAVLVERREFGNHERLDALAKQLRIWGWEKEE